MSSGEQRSKFSRNEARSVSAEITEYTWPRAGEGPDGEWYPGSPRLPVIPPSRGPGVLGAVVSVARAVCGGEVGSVFFGCV